VQQCACAQIPHEGRAAERSAGGEKRAVTAHRPDRCEARSGASRKWEAERGADPLWPGRISAIPQEDLAIRPSRADREQARRISGIDEPVGDVAAGAEWYAVRATGSDISHIHRATGPSGDQKCAVGSEQGDQRR
jgi:hypothetical protein